MSKRVVDSEVIRRLAGDTQRASEDIAAALARARRNVDQAPSWPWQRGRNWGKSNWDDVYRAVTNETTGWLFWSGGLRADAAALRELAQRAEVEAGVMGVLEQLVAIPAWLGTEVNNWLNPPPPGPSDAELKRRHDESVKAIAAAKERARNEADEKRCEFMRNKIAEFKRGRNTGDPGGQCVGFVKSFVSTLGVPGATIAPFSKAGSVYPIPQWENDCPSFSKPPWERHVGASSLMPGDVLFVNWGGPGHVAIIDSVSPDGKTFTVMDSNYWRKDGLTERIRLDAPCRADDPGILGVMRLATAAS